jgi:outer membrane lipopolysaccharide assembly protein LptE/RlpB
MIKRIAQEIRRVHMEITGDYFDMAGAAMAVVFAEEENIIRELSESEFQALIERLHGIRQPRE